MASSRRSKRTSRTSGADRPSDGPEPGISQVRETVRDGYAILVDDETSRRMADIRQRGTKPELIVRKILTSIGQRYRVENRDLPGSPDIANRRRRWVIFVHGCYWHRHASCKLATTPKRNREFWLAKFERNVARDKEALRRLRLLEFETMVVWECETRDPERLFQKLRRWSPFKRA